MSLRANLLVVAVGVCFLAFHLLPELLNAGGKLLDWLPPKLGLVILAAVIIAGLLIGTAVLPLR